MTTTASALGGFGERPRLLLAASTGGHLTQLVKFAEAAGLADEAVWVTFDSPQARSLLRGRRTIWVDYVAPRDVAGTIRAARQLASALGGPDYRELSFDGVVSNGAALALSAFAWGLRARVPRRYIESVSRTQGPSLTGRIVHALRLAETYTQHRSWSSRSWKATDSVFEGYARTPSTHQLRSSDPLNIFVTLGTIRPYRFDRLIDRIVEVTSAQDSIVWQLGATTREDLPGETHELMEAEQVLEAARRADVVITHSGVGTILQLLEETISPIVVPRERRHREHVDDHQFQIWELLRSSHVAQPTLVEDLTRESLAQATAYRVSSHRSHDQ